MLRAGTGWTEATLKVLTAETAMAKYDIKKAHRRLYAPPSKDFVVVDVPELQYIAIDGHGDPNTSETYSNAVEALFAVAYALKFASKNTLDRDFVVGPLEGLWRADDPTAFVTRDKHAWAWRQAQDDPQTTGLRQEPTSL